MSSDASLMVRLPTRVKVGLGRLAEQTNRSETTLAGEAIADYVERELDNIEGITQGLADMKAGRVVPHDEVMGRLRATIDRAAKAKP